MIRIVGNRVAIRDWQLNDLETYAHWLQPWHLWQEFDGPYYPRMAAEKIPNHIKQVRQKINQGDWGSPRNTLVIADAETDELIGRLNRYWTSKETNWLCIGIVIFDPEKWRGGLGYEAFGLWSDYLFREMPEIVRLDARTWSGNEGMMHLAEKLGYQCEAVFRKARIVKGDYYDGLGYGVLREEWAALYPDGFARHLYQLKEE
jgi:RimJ/RimL family protein N-acetyltransferase